MAKIKIKHYGIVKGGQIVLDDKDRFKKDLHNHDEKRVYITVTRHRKRRSSGQPDEDGNQNGYLYGVVVPIIATELGMYPDEVVHNLKVKFLRTGGTDDFPKTRESSSLDPKEWEEWMVQIRSWASGDMDIYIPLPNEVSYI